MVYLGELGDWLDGGVAVGTLALAVVTYRMANATSATVQGAERPIVVAEWDKPKSGAHGLALDVRNIGSGPALNIDFRAAPSIRGDQSVRFEHIPALHLDALASGERRAVVIETGPRDPDYDFWMLGVGRVVTMTYQSAAGVDYWTNAVLDDMPDTPSRTTTRPGKLPAHYVLRAAGEARRDALSA